MLTGIHHSQEHYLLHCYFPTPKAELEELNLLRVLPEYTLPTGGWANLEEPLSSNPILPKTLT